MRKVGSGRWRRAERWSGTHATANRKARRCGRDQADQRRLPNARRIHLILENRSTHRLKLLTDAYGRDEGRRLWRRFYLHGN